MTNFCKDCRWWDRMDSQLGRCRRYPAGPRNNDPMAEWVRMRDTDWCGEWAAILKEAPAALPPRYVPDRTHPANPIPLDPPRRGPGRPPKDPAA